MVANKSGKFIVRMPHVLHSSLVSEAATEGVSLNTLIVCKLAMTLGDTLMLKELMKRTATTLARTKSEADSLGVDVILNGCRGETPKANGT